MILEIFQTRKESWGTVFERRFIKTSEIQELSISNSEGSWSMDLIGGDRGIKFLTTKKGCDFLNDKIHGVLFNDSNEKVFIDMDKIGGYFMDWP